MFYSSTLRLPVVNICISVSPPSQYTHSIRAYTRVPHLALPPSTSPSSTAQYSNCRYILYPPPYPPTPHLPPPITNAHVLRLTDCLAVTELLLFPSTYPPLSSLPDRIHHRARARLISSPSPHLPISSQHSLQPHSLTASHPASLSPISPSPSTTSISVEGSETMERRVRW